MSKVVWCLFDGSGIMGLPWAEAGYQVYCFNASSGDHGEYEIKVDHPLITYVDTWIDSTFDPTGMGDNGGDAPTFIVGFPPCTMLAGSGEQHERTAEEIQEALDNVRIVETLGNKYGVPWMIENPVGKLSNYGVSRTITSIRMSLVVISVKKKVVIILKCQYRMPTRRKPAYG